MHHKIVLMCRALLASQEHAKTSSGEQHKYREVKDLREEVLFVLSLLLAG
jgi:hypothetical protein